MIINPLKKIMLLFGLFKASLKVVQKFLPIKMLLKLYINNETYCFSGYCCKYHKQWERIQAYCSSVGEGGR